MPNPDDLAALLAQVMRRLRALETRQFPFNLGDITSNITNAVDWFIDPVEDYGAVGNGTADDTEAFVDAIAEANTTGKAIIVRPGYTFGVNDLTITTPTVFVGFGRGTSVFKRLSASNPAIDVAASNCEFHHIEFDNNSLSGTCVAVTAGSAHRFFHCIWDNQEDGASSRLLTFAADVGSHAHMSECFFDTNSSPAGYCVGLPTDTAHMGRQFLGCGSNSRPFMDLGNSLLTIIVGSTGIGAMNFGTTGQGHIISNNNFGVVSGITFKGDRLLVTANIALGINFTATTATVTNSVFTSNIIGSGSSIVSATSQIANNITA